MINLDVRILRGSTTSKIYAFINIDVISARIQDEFVCNPDLRGYNILFSPIPDCGVIK